MWRLSLLSTDVEAVRPVCCHPGGDAELVHICPSLRVDGLSVLWDIRGEPSAVLNRLFSSCLSSGAPVFVCLFVPCLLPQEQRPFFDSVRQRSGQPRSLQHLCRCALRLQLGARCYSAVSKLDIPGSVRDYLLLCNDGTLHWLHIVYSFLTGCCLFGNWITFRFF